MLIARCKLVIADQQIILRRAIAQRHKGLKSCEVICKYNFDSCFNDANSNVELHEMTLAA